MLDAAKEIAAMKKFAMVTETVIMNQANKFISIIYTKTIFHFTMKITKYMYLLYLILKYFQLSPIQLNNQNKLTIYKRTESFIFLSLPHFTSFVVLLHFIISLSYTLIHF